MPPDPPEGRLLLIRHLTRDMPWRPENVIHPNRAVALTEIVYATDSPAETMTRLSRFAGRPEERDPLGGYRVRLLRGCVRIFPTAAADVLFPGAPGTPPLIGLTLTTEVAGERVIHAGGVAIRFVASPS